MGPHSNNDRFWIPIRSPDIGAEDTWLHDTQENDIQDTNENCDHQHNDTEDNSTQNWVMLCLVPQISTSCRVTSCWMSPCWVALRLWNRFIVKNLFFGRKISKIFLIQNNSSVSQTEWKIKKKFFNERKSFFFGLLKTFDVNNTLHPSSHRIQTRPTVGAQW